MQGAGLPGAAVRYDVIGELVRTVEDEEREARGGGRGGRAGRRARARGGEAAAAADSAAADSAGRPRHRARRPGTRTASEAAPCTATSRASATAITGGTGENSDITRRLPGGLARVAPAPRGGGDERGAKVDTSAPPSVKKSRTCRVETSWNRPDRSHQSRRPRLVGCTRDRPKTISYDHSETSEVFRHRMISTTC